MAWFETIEYLPGGNKLRVAQISDLHLLVDGELFHGIDSVAYLRQVLSHLAMQTWDLVVITGDISQDHSAQSYQLLAELCREYLSDTPVARLPGNHDEIDCLAQWLSEPPLIKANHLQFAQWHLLLLNSKGPQPSGLISSAHFKEIAEKLNSIPKNHYVGIYVHHHPLPMNAYIDKHILVNGVALLNQLATFAQVQFLAHGHVHQQNQLTYPCEGGDLAVLATPSTSMQFVAGSMQRGNEDKGPAYRVFELDSSGQFDTHVVWLRR